MINSLKKLNSPSVFKYRSSSIRLITILIFAVGIFFLPSPGLSNEEKPSPQILAQDDVFILMSNGVVIDKKRKLMWAQSDNTAKISIDEAKIYVKQFRLAGYDDWKIPDIQELESLMVPDMPNETSPTEGCSGNYQIHPFFQLTCCCPWALQDNGTRPAAYPFIKKVSGGSMWHHKSDTIGNRILPVRDID